MSWFDRFATRASASVARAWFFTACVLLVVVWLPTLVLLPLDTSQLIINTVTTIITFLMVALLQNTQDRSTRALHHKLDALARGLALVLDHDGDGADATELAGLPARHRRCRDGIRRNRIWVTSPPITCA